MQEFIKLTRFSPRPRRPSLFPNFSTFYANKMSAPKAAETDTQAQNVASTTGVTGDSIKKALETGIGAQHVDVEDMSGKKVQERAQSDWPR